MNRGHFGLVQIFATASPTLVREDQGLERRPGKHLHCLVASLPQSLTDRDGPDPRDGPGLYSLVVPVVQQECLSGCSVCPSRPSVVLNALPVGPACAVVAGVRDVVAQQEIKANAAATPVSW